MRRDSYAGTSDSGFRDEVEAEQALAHSQYLAEVSADADRTVLTGPVGAEAEAKLAEFARCAVFDGHAEKPVMADHVRMPGLERPRRRDDRDAGPEADHQPPAGTGGHGHPAVDRVRGGEQRTGVGQQLSARVGQRYAVAIPG
ncbi:hypothetical protein, partial [Streptomyces sp. NPDC050704]|uniref:hypothetical protein n=1 Tax=Streptomyces sp. NPDC050704 TaxID=3157219 RepID=UPI0034395009